MERKEKKDERISKKRLHLTKVWSVFVCKKNVSL